MSFSATKREAVWLKTNGKCYYCGCELYNEFVIDHIHPKINGGKNDYSNLAATCILCNATKGSLSLEEFRIKIKNLIIDYNPKIELLKKFYHIEYEPTVFYFEREING